MEKALTGVKAFPLRAIRLSDQQLYWRVGRDLESVESAYGTIPPVSLKPTHCGEGIGAKSRLPSLSIPTTRSAGQLIVKDRHCCPMFTLAMWLQAGSGPPSSKQSTTSAGRTVLTWTTTSPVWPGVTLHT